MCAKVTPKLTDTWIYDNGRGLELIPGGNVEVLLNLPAYERIGITLGVGIQIATSAFHTYNHALVFTARMPF